MTRMDDMPDVTSEAVRPHYGRGHPFANRYEIVAEICQRLSDGEPLAQICRDSHMPNPSALHFWCAADDAIAHDIAQAREFGADSIALDALIIADDITGDVQRDKLRVDTRLKLLAKWNPKKYGESTQLRHADANGEKLDTAPLVGELLGVIGPSDSPGPRRIAGRSIAQVDSAPAHPQRPARIRYKPLDDVGDLV